jgi:adenylate cyclase
MRWEYGRRGPFQLLGSRRCRNIASRIEAACKAASFDILVSEDSAKSLAGYALLDAGKLALRGKTGRTGVYAVVGDEKVAASAEFAELQAIHDQLLETLRSGPAASRQIVALAKSRAARVAVGLEEFYECLSRRTDHFHSDPIAANINLSRTSV